MNSSTVSPAWQITDCSWADPAEAATTVQESSTRAFLDQQLRPARHGGPSVPAGRLDPDHPATKLGWQRATW
jgi:hypothetical protein